MHLYAVFVIHGEILYMGESLQWKTDELIWQYFLYYPFISTIRSLACSPSVQSLYIFVFQETQLENLE